MSALADLGPLTRIGGCSHPIQCFDMGRTKRPRQLLSASPTTAFPSSQGDGVHSAHKTAQPIHVTKEGFSYGQLLLSYSSIQDKFFLSVVLIAFLITLTIFMQVTQQVYVAKDWVRNANNKFDTEAQTRSDVEKALGTANHKKMQPVEQLKAVGSVRQSAEAGLKIAEAQAEDQCKQLYTTQLNLATEQAAILDLKAKLQKAQEALKVAQEAVKAAEIAAYEHRVLETEARLTAEVIVVCRDYCIETYNQALDQAGVPADSDLRRVD